MMKDAMKMLLIQLLYCVKAVTPAEVINEEGLLCNKSVVIKRKKKRYVYM